MIIKFPVFLQEKRGCGWVGGWVNTTALCSPGGKGRGRDNGKLGCPGLASLYHGGLFVSVGMIPAFQSNGPWF